MRAVGNSVVRFRLSRCALVPILVVVGWLSTGCDQLQPPIKIGFVGPLTGRHSDLGGAGRDGVTLAVEEINGAGGIDGRPVELITRDDRQDPEAALQADRDLIDQGVTAIIGHMTSAMTMAAYPLVREGKVLMISPTTTTNELTGLDDAFIRVMPPHRSETDFFARTARETLGSTRMSAVYDLSNSAYTMDYLKNFSAEFESLGGRMVAAVPFHSGPEVHFADLTRQLLEGAPDAVLIVAGALDTAMLCQHIRLAGSKVPILSSGWAMTADFLSQAGRAAEGVHFAHLICDDSDGSGYARFKQAFQDRFHREPGFGSLFAYEAARVLFAGLARGASPERLKAAILEHKVFHGVLGDFELDSFGDARRNLCSIQVVKGRFESLE